MFNTSTKGPTMERARGWWRNLRQRWTENPHRVFYDGLVTTGKLLMRLAAASVASFVLWWCAFSVIWGSECRSLSRSTNPLGRAVYWFFDGGVSCDNWHGYTERPAWVSLGLWATAVVIIVAAAFTVGFLLRQWVALKRRAGLV
jgi:hypothetical protein